MEREETGGCGDLVPELEQCYSICVPPETLVAQRLKTLASSVQRPSADRRGGLPSHTWTSYPNGADPW